MPQNFHSVGQIQWGGDSLTTDKSSAGKWEKQKQTMLLKSEPNCPSLRPSQLQAEAHSSYTGPVLVGKQSLTRIPHTQPRKFNFIRSLQDRGSFSVLFMATDLHTFQANLPLENIYVCNNNLNLVNLHSFDYKASLKKLKGEDNITVYIQYH